MSNVLNFLSVFLFLASSSFVRFVTTPEVLERFVTLEREIAQIQESIQSNEAQNIDMAMEGRVSITCLNDLAVGRTFRSYIENLVDLLGADCELVFQKKKSNLIALH